MVLKEMGLQSLIIDMNDDILETFIAKEGDYKSRGIALQILKNRQEINTTGITVEFYAKPADGKVYMVTAEVKDATKGMYEIIYPTSILQPGIVKCEIRLVNQEDDEIITTKQFKLKVYSSIANDDIFEGVDVEPLIEVLTKAARNEEERIQAENERIQAENARKSSENTRELNEQTRIQNENIRQSNEQTRQQNEAIRQQNEQERIGLYNALKDLDVSQYELRLQKLEHDTSVEEFILEEAYESVISLPSNVVNGQINDISIKGLTATNLVKNGDFRNGTENWGTTDVNNFIVEDNIAKFTANNKYGRIRQSKYFIKNHVYYISAYVKTDTNEVGIDISSVGRTYHSGSGNFERLSRKVEWTLDSSFWSFTIRDYRSEGFTEIQATNCFLIDLTALGLEDKTVEELDAMFPYYFEGTKSTLGAIRLKSVGKNLFDGKWLPVGTRYSPNASTPFPKEKLENSSGILKPIRIQQGKSYSVSCTGAMLDGIFWYDENGYYIDRVFSYINRTPPNNAKYMTIDIRDITNIENVKLQIEVNNTTTEFEDYKESTLYILGKDEEGNILELHSLPNGTKDEINVAERRVIKRTKKIIFDGSENWTEFTTAYADSYGFYRITLNGWVTQNKAVTGYNTGLAWNDLATFRIVSYIAAGGLPNSIAFHMNGNLHLSLPRDYIDANYSPTLDGMKQYLNDHPITLIYQLAEPIEIPIEVFGNLQSYENGTVYIDTIIPKVDFYDEQEGITVTVPIKVIDTLYKVDKETGYLHPLDISQVVIAEDGLSFTHPELADGDLVDGDYVPNLESTNPCTSMVLPTNLKASVNSLLSAERRNEGEKRINRYKFEILFNTIEQLQVKITELEQRLEGQSQ